MSERSRASAPQQPAGTHQRFLRRAAKFLSHGVRSSVSGPTPSGVNTQPALAPAPASRCFLSVLFLSLFNSVFSRCSVPAGGPTVPLAPSAAVTLARTVRVGAAKPPG